MTRKISFTQSGGFAGLTLGCELDSDLLSPEASADLERLLKQWTGSETQPPATRSPSRADAPDGAARRVPPAGARDLTSYTITVTTEQGSQAFRFDDASMPAELEGLLEQLRSCARPKR